MQAHGLFIVTANMCRLRFQIAILRVSLMTLSLDLDMVKTYKIYIFLPLLYIERRHVYGKNFTVSIKRKIFNTVCFVEGTGQKFLARSVVRYIVSARSALFLQSSNRAAESERGAFVCSFRHLL